MGLISTITKSSFDKHLTQVGNVLRWLQGAGLRVNAAKSFFAEAEMEYLSNIWDTFSRERE